MKPKCCICRKEIDVTKYYFITKRGSLCVECGRSYKGKVSKIYSDKKEKV